MSWQQWVLVVLFGLNTVLSVTSIDEPRKPITSKLAAELVVVNALLAWMVVSI